jgi:hypothetical protein
MYWSKENFGRLDVYLTIIMILCMLLLLWEKAEWLVIPLSLLAVLIHEGYVFTNIGIVLAILLWKIYRGRENKKYWFILIGSLLVVSMIFIYMEFLRMPITQDTYDVIRNQAMKMSEDGCSYSEGLMNGELLRQGVFMDEIVWHLRNYVETPIFLCLTIPYWMILVYTLRGIVRRCQTNIDRLVWVLLCLGVITILPEMILKVDYGRYFFWIIMYFLLLCVYLVAMQENVIILQLEDTGNYIVQKWDFAIALPVCPLLFMPFRDVYISDITTRIMDFIGFTFHFPTW